MYSRIQRALHRLQSVDIDRQTKLPDGVTVVNADEFGPLVISIANATVFPDGSVKSNGRWMLSKRFGLTAPIQPPTDVNTLESECAVVGHVRPTQRDLVETVGPRLATLGRIRPGTAALFPPTRQPLTQTVLACGLTPAGVIIHGGTARAMPAALFARLPFEDDRDGQKSGFAQIFHTQGKKLKGSVYLESDAVIDTVIDGPTFTDVRFSYEQSGSTLVSAKRFWPGDIARLASVIAEAAEVVLETEELRPFARFASQSASTHVAQPVKSFRRDSARMTATSRFDIDAALRSGSSLPRGVEIISRPDYEVPDTTLDNHRVFVNGKWRSQFDDVLAGRSLGPWILSVRNAIVAPNGSVLLEDGTQLGGDYFGELPQASMVDGWVIGETSRPSGLALTINRAFGHGLLQVAPRLDALMQHDRTMDVLVPEFTWDDTALLKRVGVERERVRRVSRANLHHLVKVPELIVSTQLHPEQATARADPIWQSDFVSRFVGSSPSTQRRIYFARQDASGARGGCVNRAALDELAEEFGYEKVHPELLSFDEQVELVASTVDLFGERGSALVWSMFMPPGSRVVSVNGRSSDSKLAHVSFLNPAVAARGSRYRAINAVLAGTTRFFEIDPIGVRRALEGL